MPRKIVDKPRNAGTLTESAFWGMIRSSLRRASRFWKPIQIAKQKAKKKYIGTNKRQKFAYECARCKGMFQEKQIEINHTIPAGSLKCAEDLPGFVERLFAEQGYECVCKECHKRITFNK